MLGVLRIDKSLFSPVEIPGLSCLKVSGSLFHKTGAELDMDRLQNLRFDVTGGRSRVRNDEDLVALDG